MIRIIVTPQQARQLESNEGPVEIVDEQGRHLGYLTQSFSKSEIDEARRRSMTEAGGRSTADVLKKLAGTN